MCDVMTIPITCTFKKIGGSKKARVAFRAKRVPGFTIHEKEKPFTSDFILFPVSKGNNIMGWKIRKYCCSEHDNLDTQLPNIHVPPAGCVGFRYPEFFCIQE